MARTKFDAGYFRSGLPYNRFGSGQRIAVILQGLMFENKPLAGPLAAGFTQLYRFLDSDYTTYVVTRRPRLPVGYTMRDMADDYAQTIREEFGGPVDVVGTSTGGSIAQHLAADHPDVVRKLVLHSSAYTLGAAAKAAQRQVAEYAREHRWIAASAMLMRFAVPPGRWYSGAGVALSALALSLTAPSDPGDLVVTVAAEDAHDFRERLAEITAPTLVTSGERDPFYSVELFQATAAGIPGAKLILYPGQGHAAAGPQFERDVLGFLLGDAPALPSA